MNRSLNLTNKAYKKERPNHKDPTRKMSSPWEQNPIIRYNDKEFGT